MYVPVIVLLIHEPLERAKSAIRKKLQITELTLETNLRKVTQWRWKGFTSVRTRLGRLFDSSLRSVEISSSLATRS